MSAPHRVTFRPKGSASSWWDVAADGLTLPSAQMLLEQRATITSSEYRIERLDLSGSWVAL